MAMLTFSKRDVESLAARLEERALSRLMQDMPMLQRDLKCAAAVLQHFATHQRFIVVVDVHNGIY